MRVLRAERAVAMDSLDDFSTEVTAEEIQQATKLQSAARQKKACRSVGASKKKKRQSTDDLMEIARVKQELAQESFAKYDADGNGWITFKELGPLLREMLISNKVTKTLDVQTLEECFDQADTNNDNKIDFEEFVKWHNDILDWARRLGEAERLAAEKQVAEDAEAALNTPEATALVYDLLVASGEEEAAAKYKRGAASAEEARILESAERVKALLELDDHEGQSELPDFSDEERARLADCFLRAQQPTDGPMAAPRRLRTNAKKNKGALPCHMQAHGSLDKVEWQSQKFIHDFEAEERRDADLARTCLDERLFVYFVEMAFGCRERMFAETLFQTITRDITHRRTATRHEGMLDFDETCTGLRAFKADSLETRAALLFCMYDIDHNGSISKNELLQMIHRYSSGPTETDLLAFVRHMLVLTKTSAKADERESTFNDYLEHVTRNGENGSVTNFRYRVLDSL